MRVEEVTLDEWAGALPAEGIEAFHAPEALRVLDDHAAGDLRLFGGFKGEEPISLLPVFVREVAGVRIALSPPTQCGILRLGPVLMSNSPKRRKREQVNNEFTERVVAALGANHSTTLTRLATTPDYGDPRPYLWSGFDVKPAFTYRLDLDSKDPDEVLKSFSKSLRREVRDGDDVDVTISVAGERGARKVFEMTRRRFAEQDMPFPLEWRFVRDLLRELGDRARVYVAETDDGGFLSGLLILYSPTTAYFWKGGSRRSHEGVSVNTLLHWRAIEDVLTHPELADVTAYDFYSANTERIAEYKSKFGGNLEAYYEIESTGLPMTVAKGVYNAVQYGNLPL